METGRANPAATVKKRPFPRSVGCPLIDDGPMRRRRGPAAMADGVHRDSMF